MFSEQQQINSYINGWKEPIRSSVAKHNPRELETSITWARVHELHATTTTGTTQQPRDPNINASIEKQTNNRNLEKEEHRRHTLQATLPPIVTPLVTAHQPKTGLNIHVSKALIAIEANPNLMMRLRQATREEPQLQIISTAIINKVAGCN